MIKSFRDKDTESSAQNKYVKKFDSILLVARKKLAMLDSVISLKDLSSVPGNRLEALSGERKGQYSIRINDQFWICFKLDGEEFIDVEITDYH